MYIVVLPVINQNEAYAVSNCQARNIHDCVRPFTISLSTHDADGIKRGTWGVLKKYLHCVHIDLSCRTLALINGCNMIMQPHYSSVLVVLCVYTNGPA